MGSKASRNTSIEALRLVAVAGIAIFHTFQWTFQAVCTGLPEYAPLAVFPYSGALGFINLLGCWANEVFFMISGYFLIPSAIRVLQNGSSARGLIYKSFTRLKKIVLPTLFYCTACLFVSMYVYPLPEISLHEIGWLTLGIEFIWVYAASVLLVPMIALARQRIGSKRAPFVVALLVFATFGINCYIAATANEVAGVVLWRKLMSAVTYLVAFIAAGEMRFVLEHHGNASGAQKSKIALIRLVAVTIALELLLSASSQYDALWKLSYKSTSVISFILAAASVAAAALHQPRHEVPCADQRPISPRTFEKTSSQPSTNAATTHFIAQVNTNESPNPKSACSIVTTQRLGRSPSGSAMKAKKQCRATTAAGIVKKSRNENTAPVAIDQRTRRLVKTRAFGAESKRRLMQDIMMSATKNEMHSSRSPIKLKNRLVENNRITRKPNVTGFENRFCKAT